MSLYLSSLPQLSATSSIILWHTVFGSLILVPTAMKSEIDKLLILYMAKKKRQGHANMIFSLSLMPFYTWTRPAVNGVIYLMTFRHGRPYITISVHGVPSASSRICLTALLNLTSLFIGYHRLSEASYLAALRAFINAPNPGTITQS